MINSKPSTWSRLMRLTSRFTSDDRGVSTVEFAIAAPFLLTLMLGLTTIVQMEKASTTVGKATATVADIIAQSPAVDEFAVESAFQAARFLTPNNADMEMYVAGISVEGDDLNPRVLWATPNKNLKRLSLPAPNSSYALLPDSLKNRTGFVVVTHAVMTHTPLYAQSIMQKDEATYEYSNYFVPRVSLTTDCNNCEQEYEDEDDGTDDDEEFGGGN